MHIDTQAKLDIQTHKTDRQTMSDMTCIYVYIHSEKLPYRVHRLTCRHRHRSDRHDNHAAATTAITCMYTCMLCVHSNVCSIHVFHLHSFLAPCHLQMRGWSCWATSKVGSVVSYTCDRQTDRQPDRHTHADIQTDRQNDRHWHADIQTDTQTDRQIQAQHYYDSYSYNYIYKYH